MFRRRVEQTLGRVNLNLPFRILSFEFCLKHVTIVSQRDLRRTRMELRQEGQQTTPRHCGGRGSPTERNDTTATEESEVNHSDIFRLRSSIVEIVEDLKLRQVKFIQNSPPPLSNAFFPLLFSFPFLRAAGPGQSVRLSPLHLTQ